MYSQLIEVGYNKFLIGSEYNATPFEKMPAVYEYQNVKKKINYLVDARYYPYENRKKLLLFFLFFYLWVYNHYS